MSRGPAAGELAEIWRADQHQISVLIDLAHPDGAVEPLLRLDPDRTFSGASMIKTFLAELVSSQVAAGSLRWEQPLQVQDAHRVGGDGVLKQFALPAELTLHDLVALMLTVSDNTATNVVIDLLGGVGSVNAHLAAAGFRSCLRARVGGRPEAADPSMEPDPRLASGPGLATVIPAEHHGLISRLADQSRHQVLWSMLEAQQDVRSLARSISEFATFGHKTGTVAGVRHDSGRLVLPQGGWLQVTCFTDHPDQVESVDHPACVAMGSALAATVTRLGAAELLHHHRRR